ncbi:hypothetical protein [Sphingomonas alpina]|uniref:Uncharacterized protein n=1 Tax=Sphingomonas alpina TaxID=653931 RepID=A0A7H0LI58_9SPHN|nr:hypothetical protein [Sphingomonas alpina]QNQ09361.1 hypothetical protein H3Z74_22310 [Sphingomonas alpina]
MSVLGEFLQLLLASCGVALLIGLPTHLILRRLGRYSLPAYLGTTALGVVAIVDIIALSAIRMPA